MLEKECRPISVETQEKIALRNNWFRNVCIAAITAAFVWKLSNGQVVVDLTQFKFQDFLSLILALFSIGLSAAFYFRGTQDSNRFYDNTYKFTKDNSEILGRIEAGFGERLRHLDEGYTGLQSRFDRIPNGLLSAKAEAEEEEQTIASKEDERSKIIEDLANRAKLQEKEKTELISKLRKMDQELLYAKGELDVLRRQIATAEYRGHGENEIFSQTSERLVMLEFSAFISAHPSLSPVTAFTAYTRSASGRSRSRLQRMGLVNSGEVTDKGRDFAVRAYRELFPQAP